MSSQFVGVYQVVLEDGHGRCKMLVTLQERVGDRAGFSQWGRWGGVDVMRKLQSTYAFQLEGFLKEGGEGRYTKKKSSNGRSL